MGSNDGEGGLGEEFDDDADIFSQMVERLREEMNDSMLSQKDELLREISDGDKMVRNLLNKLKTEMNTKFGYLKNRMNDQGELLANRGDGSGIDVDKGVFNQAVSNLHSKFDKLKEDEKEDDFNQQQQIDNMMKKIEDLKREKCDEEKMEAAVFGIEEALAKIVERLDAIRPDQGPSTQDKGPQVKLEQVILWDEAAQKADRLEDANFRLRS